MASKLLKVKRYRCTLSLPSLVREIFIKTCKLPLPCYLIYSHISSGVPNEIYETKNTSHKRLENLCNSVEICTYYINILLLHKYTPVKFEYLPARDLFNPILNSVSLYMTRD